LPKVNANFQALVNPAGSGREVAVNVGTGAVVVGAQLGGGCKSLLANLPGGQPTNIRLYGKSCGLTRLSSQSLNVVFWYKPPK
jgi:hypothetical protein